MVCRSVLAAFDSGHLHYRSGSVEHSGMRSIWIDVDRGFFRLALFLIDVTHPHFGARVLLYDNQAGTDGWDILETASRSEQNPRSPHATTVRVAVGISLNFCFLSIEWSREMKQLVTTLAT